jgi:hypothetical protein
MYGAAEAGLSEGGICDASKENHFTRSCREIF